jgi:hypothetical protein
MYTKQQAVNFAKQNNIKVKQFKNDCEQGYFVGNVKIIYCGYGNMFTVENANFGNNLGEILMQQITKQIR